MKAIAVRAGVRVSRLKKAGLVLLLLVVQLRLAASAPATVAGLVYSESSFSAIVGDRISRVWIGLLQPDGRLVGLYASVQTTRAPLSATIPPDGSWSYRKTGDRSAELTLPSVTRQLTFSSETAGTAAAGEPFTTITFTLTPDAGTAQFANSSNRSFVRSGSAAFTGFVIANGSRRVLVRAIGPTLRTFGITEFLRQPTLRISRATTNQTVATNAGWSGADLAAVHQRAGAFPLAENSGDCVVFLSLAAGAYIAEVSSPDPTDSGEAMIEIYSLP